jgi:hypothetical protein
LRRSEDAAPRLKARALRYAAGLRRPTSVAKIVPFCTRERRCTARICVICDGRRLFGSEDAIPPRLKARALLCAADLRRPALVQEKRPMG